MKLIHIGRNYGAHAKELGNALPEEPVVFLKPESALIPHHAPITLPKFSDDIHHEIELVYSIVRKNGKAHADKVSIGLDLTARGLQKELKEAGLPWEKAKSFDGSAYVASAFTALDSYPKGHHIDFMLKRNGKVVQSGHNGEMIFPIEALITNVEKYMLLETGDLIFSGTPAGVGRIEAGDQLEG